MNLRARIASIIMSALNQDRENDFLKRHGQEGIKMESMDEKAYKAAGKIMEILK